MTSLPISTPPAAPSVRPPALAARLLCASLALLAAASAVPAAHAQTASPAAAAAARRDYAIPAGPLAPAINRLGRESGALITFAPDQAAGLQTAGVGGSHTVAQALALLLAGTGLEAVARGEGTYVLRHLPTAAPARAVPASTASLGEVRVTAEAPGPESAATTEGTGSYTTRAASTATRLGLSLRETPQSVSVITRQQMDDLGTLRLEDALQHATGVTVRRERAPNFVFNARGFAMARQFDGLPLHSDGGYTENSQDLVIYDRVEVLRGAAGLTQGHGEPGGTVNLVRKRPTREFQASVQASAGSWDHYRLEGDLSGPLVEDGRIRGRLVVAGQSSRSFQNLLDERNSIAYGVVDADLTPTTTVSLGALAQRSSGVLEWWGIPFHADGSSMGLPRSTYLGADWNDNTRERKVLFANFEQALAGDWKLKASAMHTRDQFTSLQLAGLGPGWAGVPLGSSQIEPQWWLFTNEGSATTASAEVSGSFEALGRRHKLVFAALSERGEFLGFDAGYDATQPGWNMPALVDAQAWNPAAFPNPAALLPYYNNGVSTRTTRDSTSLMAATHLSITDASKLILGGRHTRLATSSAYTAFPQYNASITKSAFSPYAGLVHDLSPTLSAYASYSDIFKPQSSRAASGEYLKPIVGANYEAGIKHESPGGGLNASAAVFRIEQKNRAYLDTQAGAPCNVNTNPCYLPSGTVRSQGFELEVAGEVRPGWQVAAGYTFNQTRYVKDEANANRPYSPYTPRHMLRVATTYRLPPALGPWTVGGSLRAQSSQYVEDGGVRMHQGGYAVAGLMAQYAWSKGTTVTLNIDNLFDRTYWDNLGTLSYDNLYGRPRSATLTVRHQF